MRLSNECYERIKMEVSYIFEDYDVKTLPIDVFDVAKKMNIKIVYASDIIKKYKGIIDELKLFCFPQSYLYFNENEQRFYVYIDDIGTTINRQRFSIAHEIMHIRLGHVEQSKKNEAEANFGAIYMLTPTSLILMDPNNLLLQDEEFIKSVFGVSDAVATSTIRYYYNRIHYVDLEPRNYEKSINNLLGKALMDFLKIKKSQYWEYCDLRTI